jgi:NitT/TauT family transport system permease protein
MDELVRSADIAAPHLARRSGSRRDPSFAPRVRGSGLRLLSLLGVVALWWIGARLAATPQLLPTPDRVLAFAWRALQDGSLPLNVAISLARVAAAFTIAMTVGAVCGYLAGRWTRLDALFDPWMVIALNVPVLVIVVLSYIWLGLNEAAAILAVALAKTPTVFVTVREGARALDPAFRDLERVFRVPLWRRLRWITLPQLLPYLAAAARSGLSITWKIVLVVELLGRPNGVGFVLNLYFQSFDVTGILGYGLSFAVIMLLVETAVLRPWERRVNAWRRGT